MIIAHGKYKMFSNKYDNWKYLYAHTLILQLSVKSRGQAKKWGKTKVNKQEKTENNRKK